MPHIFFSTNKVIQTCSLANQNFLALDLPLGVERPIGNFLQVRIIVGRLKSILLLRYPKEDFPYMFSWRKSKMLTARMGYMLQAHKDL